MMAGPAGIVAFDLDGTLVPKTTVCLHLAPWVGHHGIGDLERLYAEGQITNTEVAEIDAPFYKNKRRSDAWRQLDQLRLIDGVTDTIAWLKDRSLIPVVATITHRFAADFLCDRYGFAAASGCEMDESEDGVLLGTIARHFDAEDKVTFVAEIAQDLGLGFEHVVAVGDSTSDLPLFDAAGLSIALNASDNARAAADAQVDTDDLRDVLPLIERYFSSDEGHIDSGTPRSLA